MLKRLAAAAADSTDVIRRLLLSYDADAIDAMIFRYIKKFLTFFGLGLLGDDRDNDNRKLRVKLLLPGLESGWYNGNNTGSFKYKNRCEENNNNNS